MPRTRVKKISKEKNGMPEGKAWKEWFDALGVEEHEKYLSQLGLDKEDIKEWEEMEGCKKPSVSKEKKK